MSVLHHKANIILRNLSGYEVSRQIEILDRQITRAKNQLVAASLILAREKLTNEPPPQWGSYVEPRPEPAPEPQRRIPTFPQEPRFRSGFGSGFAPKPRLTTTGYRDEEGRGSCFVETPLKVSVGQGWSTSMHVVRKRYKVYDLQ